MRTETPVSGSIWDAAKTVADARGERISEVIRRQLEEYVRRNRKLLDDGES